MKLKSICLATAMLAGTYCQVANAAPEVQFSGFGTVGYVTTNSDNAVFRNGFTQDKGATNSDTDFGVDSRLGLQVNVKFDETFSAVGQILARETEGDFGANLEWFYGQAKLADWVDLRVGRMVLPVFMVSDSRYVGYAGHWLRSPQEVYGFYPPTSFDGAQAVLRQNLADTQFTLRLSAGKSKADVYFGSLTPTPVAAKLDYSRLYSASMTAENGNWLGSFGYTVGDKTKLQGPGVSTEGKDKFTGLGVQYDNGTLLVMSEYVMRRYTSNDAYDKAFDSDGYYVSAGYRFGSFMPYVSTSTFKPKGAYWKLAFPTAGNGKTNAIGVRWDAMKNTAVKVQIEETKGTPASQVMVVDPAFDPSKKVRAISVGVDFVF
jgi:hypothetical protein